jgi:hypothetical protein
MTERTGSDVGIMPSFLSALCLAVAVLFSTAAGASVSDDTFEIAAMTTVRGTVHFEKRNTVVPYSDSIAGNEFSSVLPVCNENFCPRSNPYWAVVIADGQRQYEFHQPFAIGASRAPNFVEVSGVKLRPGFEIALEGSIDSISDSYGIISDVKRISVLSSRPMPGLERLEAGYGVQMAYGWSCASLEDPSNGLNAYVWYGRRSHTDGLGFHLRVIAKRIADLANLHQGVTEISYLQMKQTTANLIYQGAARDLAATLAIQKTVSPQINNYPSSLRISNLQGSMGVRMFCNPFMMPVRLPN